MSSYVQNCKEISIDIDNLKVHEKCVRFEVQNFEKKVYVKVHEFQMKASIKVHYFCNSEL